MKSLAITKNTTLSNSNLKTHMGHMAHMCFSHAEFSKRILKYYLGMTAYYDFFANMVFLNPRQWETAGESKIRILEKRSVQYIMKNILHNRMDNCRDRVNVKERETIFWKEMYFLGSGQNTLGYLPQKSYFMAQDIRTSDIRRFFAVEKLLLKNAHACTALFLGGQISKYRILLNEKQENTAVCSIGRLKAISQFVNNSELSKAIINIGENESIVNKYVNGNGKLIGVGRENESAVNKYAVGNRFFLNVSSRNIWNRQFAVNAANYHTLEKVPIFHVIGKNSFEKWFASPHTFAMSAIKNMTISAHMTHVGRVAILSEALFRKGSGQNTLGYLPQKSYFMAQDIRTSDIRRFFAVEKLLLKNADVRTSLFLGGQISKYRILLNEKQENTAVCSIGRLKAISQFVNNSELSKAIINIGENESIVNKYVNGNGKLIGVGRESESAVNKYAVGNRFFLNVSSRNIWNRQFAVNAPNYDALAKVPIYHVIGKNSFEKRFVFHTAGRKTFEKRLAFHAAGRKTFEKQFVFHAAGRKTFEKQFVFHAAGRKTFEKRLVSNTAERKTFEKQFVSHTAKRYLLRKQISFHIGNGNLLKSPLVSYIFKHKISMIAVGGKLGLADRSVVGNFAILREILSWKKGRIPENRDSFDEQKRRNRSWLNRIFYVLTRKNAVQVQTLTRPFLLRLMGRNTRKKQTVSVKISCYKMEKQSAFGIISSNMLDSRFRPDVFKMGDLSAQPKIERSSFNLDLGVKWTYGHVFLPHGSKNEIWKKFTHTLMGKSIISGNNLQGRSVFLLCSRRTSEIQYSTSMIDSQKRNNQEYFSVSREHTLSYLSEERFLQKRIENRLTSDLKEAVKNTEESLQINMETELQKYIREINSLGKKVEMQEKQIGELRTVEKKLREQRDDGEKMKKLNEFFNNDMELERKRYGIR